MLTKKEQSLLDALLPQAQREGVEIVTLEIVGSKKAPTIRVYIDTENGVSFDELARTQAWINQVMDQIDPFPGAYMLEVSSPGIDRPLRTPEHFCQAVGQTVVVTANAPIEGRAKFTGTLTAADQASVTLDCNGTTVTLPLSDLKRAHIKGVISF